MPGFLTHHAHNLVLDYLFGGRAFTPPPVLYIGLSLTRAFRGGSVTEPSGGGYARVPFANTPEQFAPAAPVGKANASPVVFPEPSEGWGAVSSVFVADAPAGGNVLAMADLPAPRVVRAGDPAPRLAAAALAFGHL